MPESTEQILHPEKYTAGEAPVEVDAAGRPRDTARRRLDGPAPGHVRRVPARDLAARVWRRDERGARRPRRAGAAIAWRSSRARTVRGGSCSTRRGTRDADAAEFHDAAQPRSRTWPTRPGLRAGGEAVTILIASRRRDAPGLDASSARPGLTGPGGPRRDRLHRFGRGDPQQGQAFASVIRAASARARRAADRSGSSGSTTRASR